MLISIPNRPRLRIGNSIGPFCIVASTLLTTKIPVRHNLASREIDYEDGMGDAGHRFEPVANRIFNRAKWVYSWVATPYR